MAVHSCQLGGHFWKCVRIGTCSKLHHRSSCSHRCGKTYPKECLHFIDSCPAPGTQRLRSMCMMKKLRRRASVIFILRLLLDSFKSDTGQWSQHILYKKCVILTGMTGDRRTLCIWFHVTSISMLPNSDWLHFVWDRPFCVSRKHHRSGCEVPATEG